VKPWELPPVDMVVGSVAMNPKTGRRLGKSHGYAEIEWGIISSLGKVEEETPVAATVHEPPLATCASTSVDVGLSTLDPMAWAAMHVESLAYVCATASLKHLSQQVLPYRCRLTSLAALVRLYL
jgi:hypothetical protein